MSLILMVSIALLSNAQQKVKGFIYEADQGNEKIALMGANIIWQGTSVGAVSKENGSFEIPYLPNYKKLIISFVGFKSDTLDISGPTSNLEHWLRPTDELDEITISGKRQSMAKSYLQSQNIITVSSDELLKAACCNLSESFETNPSIDVNFNDAVTGTRQIKMLGLTSPYILIATENIPSIRGAS
ncbi:MAG: carboxypeptidase-like regulatory domain-containing protein, partial [Bacteroidia bacterium]|nr:carboxypeptidase-like regulatory domain-containing protein [Bacteroidia bacterium]